MIALINGSDLIEVGNNLCKSKGTGFYLEGYLLIIKILMIFA